MQKDAPLDLETLKKDLETAWREIPKHFRNEHTIKRTLQCRLYALLIIKGFRIVADYMPPRIAERPIDLIVLGEDETILHALCIDTVVTLAAVKSLTSFEATNKVILTTGIIEKKVNESKFFLKPEVQHIHLQPFEHSPYL